MEYAVTKRLGWCVSEYIVLLSTDWVTEVTGNGKVQIGTVCSLLHFV